jgi:uncharacterized protein YdaU (DUF1376 family)
VILYDLNLMKSDAWMPLWVGDYLADTRRLDTTQHGAYLLIIMDYWRNGPPPNNDEILARITLSTTDQWLKLRPHIEPFFQLNNGTWHHKRIDLERDKSKESYEARCRQTQAARNARLTYNSSVTDNVTDNVPKRQEYLPTDQPHSETPKNIANRPNSNVTDSVTSSVTDSVTKNVTEVQSQSQSQSPEIRGVAGGKRMSPSVLSIQNQTELKRVEARLQEIRNLATVTASGKTFTQPQLTELSVLKSRRQQLLDALGFKA